MQPHEIQSHFKNLMLQPITALENPSAEIIGLFDEGHIPLQERLKVYHNNVVGSLTLALMSNFPLLEKLVGADFLKALCREYVILNPPCAAWLYAYGESFAHFISNHPHTQNLPYLTDVAQMEWFIKSAEHAPDDSPLDQATLAAIPMDHLSDVKLELRQSSHLLKSRYPLLALRDFCLNPESLAPDLSAATETHLMIYRPSLEVEIVPLSQDEYKFLENIHAGNNLGDALTQTLENNESFNISTALQKHLLLGTFKSL
jgi:hypothetical protein